MTSQTDIGAALRRRSRRRASLAVSTAALLASLAAGTGWAGAAATRPAGGPQPAARLPGGTATFAEAVGTPPDYIFPFEGSAFYSQNNTAQFQYLMFRPLYWFGAAGQPVLDPSLSLASPPAYSGGDTRVTIELRHEAWSDGEPVQAADVMFWLNMLKVEKQNWGGYVPGAMPDDIQSVRAPDASTVVITLTGRVNPEWFTSDELSQITPLPLAWDISATGQPKGTASCASAAYSSVTLTSKGSPASAAAKSCAEVFTHLSEQAGYDPVAAKESSAALATYATNPLWQVVDGPWHLVSFTADGLAVFRPNPRYTGPVKPTLTKFVEQPFTSAKAEFQALVAGKVTVGYLPAQDVTSPARSAQVAGPNNPRLAARYKLVPLYSWGINYFPYNFNSKADGGYAGSIFSQLYFRQAFQSLVDQSGIIKSVDDGYGVPTYGPVPVVPANQLATSTVKKNPYPYDPAKAVRLLRAHGWNVVPGGITTCANAKECHVPAGTPLAFAMEYVDSGPGAAREAQTEQRAWSLAGIRVNLTAASFDTVLGDATACSGSSCTWELEDWGEGWTYAPDYYPTGEETFLSSATSNVGSYLSARNDQLIRSTVFSPDPKHTTLANWQNYLAVQLPVVWQPSAAYSLTEVQQHLAGVVPQSPLLTITPESWYFSG
ncbi:MAG TPA: ABC transporter substrate-binding protein [Acidimicrobiales bacterium]|nr:ABC transporter substrate-binding protein [Acidimicrobiales bacterium]